MHNVNYLNLIQQLGLSTHPRQAARRMQKYPQHFKAVDNTIYITTAYANFLTHCANNTQMAQLIKGGN